jgi:hypothetical protein
VNFFKDILFHTPPYQIKGAWGLIKTEISYLSREHSRIGAETQKGTWKHLENKPV